IRHAARRTLAIFAWRSDVMGVGADAVASQFAVDSGSASFRVFQLFKHDHARTFSKHEPIAVGVPGTAGRGGIVVPRTKRPRRGEPAHTKRADSRFGTTRNHD